jgi:hypothetical protein
VELALLPLSDAEADGLLESIPEDARNECWWLVLRDGRPIRGNGGGGVALLRELRLTRPLGVVLAALRLSRLVDALDTFVARFRGSLGPFTPEGPAPRRYP